MWTKRHSQKVYLSPEMVFGDPIDVDVAKDEKALMDKS
jgi:hypothetical protein